MLVEYSLWFFNLLFVRVKSTIMNINMKNKSSSINHNSTEKGSNRMLFTLDNEGCLNSAVVLLKHTII